jgi:hypothetical protein
MAGSQGVIAGSATAVGNLTKSAVDKATATALFQHASGAVNFAGAKSLDIVQYLIAKDSTGLLGKAFTSLSAGDRGAWLALGGTAFAGYVLLCNSLRFRRVKQMEKKFGYDTREKMASMTTTDAQKIISYMSELEYPKVFLTSVEFALFKVCLSSPHLQFYISSGKLS